MKVCIYNNPGNYVGGPRTFVRNLSRYLKSINYSFSNKNLFSKCLFFPISAPVPQINFVRSLGGRIIQRLDGVYYPEKHGNDHHKLNKDIKDIYQNYADFVVFQSEYSKTQCFQMFGIKPDDSYNIIYNGADGDVFFPDKNGSLGGEVTFVATGNFQSRDKIIPIIEALDILESKKIDFKFKIVGPIDIPEKDEIIARSYVVHEGEKELSDIAQILRASDIFLFSHLNPPCPNSVIEAISSGLPVVSFDSGAMRELCFFNKELLVELPDKVFHLYEDLDATAFCRKVEEVIKKFDYFKEKAMRHHKEFSLEKSAGKYVEVFEEQCSAKRFGLKPVLFTKMFFRIVIKSSAVKICKKVRRVLHGT